LAAPYNKELGKVSKQVFLTFIRDVTERSFALWKKEGMGWMTF
jgi:hypothetical protein